MADELARHGYRISRGTLYPLLHGLEKKGYLRSAEKRALAPFFSSSALRSSRVTGLLRYYGFC
jgi:DNA-binding IclR family transcriptional regulator